MFLPALFIDLPAASRGGVPPGNRERGLLLDAIRAAGPPDAVILISLAPPNNPLMFQGDGPRAAVLEQRQFTAMVFMDGQHSPFCFALLLRKLYP